MKDHGGGGGPVPIQTGLTKDDSDPRTWLLFLVITLLNKFYLLLYYLPILCNKALHCAVSLRSHNFPGMNQFYQVPNLADNSFHSQVRTTFQLQIFHLLSYSIQPKS